APQSFGRGFEPNLSPGIEFDRRDFPWLFTPARETDASSDPAKGSNRLRPWLALVVVRQQAGVTVKAEPGRPLPVLQITGPAVPADELQDLGDSWGWAHGQVAGTADEVSDVLAGEPARNCSRLVCPRKLSPGTSYLAVLVP